MASTALAVVPLPASDKNLIIPEYKIDLLNKNKKIIKIVENFEKIETNSNKYNFGRKEFSNKKFIKRNRFKKKYNYYSKMKKNNFEGKKTANY